MAPMAHGRTRLRPALGLAAASLAWGLTGCSADDSRADRPSPQVSEPSAPPSSEASTQPSAGSPPEPEAAAVGPGDFRKVVALGAVRHLAGTIGPREATSPAYARAAQWVGQRFRRLGLTVRRQRFGVPAGNSWGVPVPAGSSVNVIALPPGFVPARPHLVVGAHLDTVPQAPGAEDNASGIGVLLAVAEATAARRTRLPVVFVAFGAEEPRGETDADHHYGSRTYVRELPPGQREAVVGMLSLDRVGVGDVVPIGSAREGADRATDRVTRAAGAAEVPFVREVNRSSDHWQFVQAGLPGVRLGSTPYAGYHSPQDVPEIIEPGQLERVGRVVLQWLAP